MEKYTVIASDMFVAGAPTALVATPTGERGARASRVTADVAARPRRPFGDAHAYSLTDPIQDLAFDRTT